MENKPDQKQTEKEQQRARIEKIKKDKEKQLQQTIRK